MKQSEVLMELESLNSIFELILLLRLDKRFSVDKHFPVEQFEATVSQSTAPSPLTLAFHVPTALEIEGKVRGLKPEGNTNHRRRVQTA